MPELGLLGDKSTIFATLFRGSWLYIFWDRERCLGNSPIFDSNSSTSLRSRRQHLAPGVSPGISSQIEYKPALAGDRNNLPSLSPAKAGS
jgi:hypothetical protein